MKKLISVLLIGLLVSTSSVVAYAESADTASFPAKAKSPTSTKTTTGTEKLVTKSEKLNWVQTGGFTVYVGKSYTLSAKHTDKAKITYSSSDNTVLKIDSQGKVTPLKAGSVVIYAASGDVKIGKKLTVKQPEKTTTPKTEVPKGGNGTGPKTTTGGKPRPTNPNFGDRWIDDAGNTWSYNRAFGWIQLSDVKIIYEKDYK